MNNIKRFFNTTFASLSIRNFRLYFAGQGISLSGTWMQSIAQAWLVLKLTNSGTQLGLVVAAQFLPILFLGTWGGVIADRFPKIKILYFTQSIACVLGITLGILVWTNTVHLWMVYALAIALGFVNLIDSPTRQVFVYDMVGEDLLNNAVSLNTGEMNLARVVGPAIAGALIATVGLAPCFILNGLSYVPVLAVLRMMRTSELHSTHVVSKAKGQVMEGLRYVASNHLLRNSLIIMAIVGTLTYEFQVILPLFAQYTFHGDAGTYAILSAALGLGAAVGGLYTAGYKHVTPKLLIIVSIIFGVTLIVTSLMPTLLLAILSLLVVGVLSVAFISFGTVILQMETEPRMRGRVMGLWTIAFMGSTPIGGPIIGFIGEHIGPRAGLITGGTAAIVAGIFGMIVLSKKKLEEIEKEEPLPITAGK